MREIEILIQRKDLQNKIECFTQAGFTSRASALKEQCAERQFIIGYQLYQLTLTNRSPMGVEYEYDILFVLEIGQLYLFAGDIRKCENGGWRMHSWHICPTCCQPDEANE